jgi:hypothetical protein
MIPTLREELESRLGDPLTPQIEYTGPIDQEQLHLWVRQIETLAMIPSVRKRLTTLWIELIQNIQRHCLRPNDTSPTAAVLLALHGTQWHLLTRNLINREDTHPLVNWNTFLSTQSAQELKQLFLDRRKLPPSNTGAGLGLIDIHRKTARSLDLWIQQNENMSFVVIHATLANH